MFTFPFKFPQFKNPKICKNKLVLHAGYSDITKNTTVLTKKNGVIPKRVFEIPENVTLTQEAHIYNQTDH